MMSKTVSLTLVCLSLFAVDIISAIEFDKFGDHLATGDRGGRVVLFERTDAKVVVFLDIKRFSLCLLGHLYLIFLLL